MCQREREREREKDISLTDNKIDSLPGSLFERSVGEACKRTLATSYWMYVGQCRCVLLVRIETGQLGSQLSV